MTTRKKLPPVNILVIDEIQDMNTLYYQFVCKFIRDLGRDVQLLVLGDSYQGLYEFKGADTRFLTYACSLWEGHSHFPFKSLKLSTSYRVTNPIADFVNEAMLGYPRIQAQKYGHNVLFIRHTNSFDTARIIAHRILDQLRNGLKPDDIFILAASVKSPNSPLKIVENILVAQGYPCYTPMNETASIKSSVIKNKIIFASFHQSKGRERKLVIVYGIIIAMQTH
jgi:superfamily I DNA/RNA helicase